LARNKPYFVADVVQRCYYVEPRSAASNYCHIVPLEPAEIVVIGTVGNRIWLMGEARGCV
jgi:hypothetical protein